MILDVLKVVALVLAVMFLWDVWQLVRKQSSALDRDQQIMDSIEGIEDYVSLDDLDIIAVDVSDMSEHDAVMAFIDAYREKTGQQ